MAGLDPATQPVSVSERKDSLRPQTRARWVAASRAAMVNRGYSNPSSASSIFSFSGKFPALMSRTSGGASLGSK